MNPYNELEALRSEIDDVDQNIVNLFLWRMQIAEQIGRLRNEFGIEIEDKDRDRDFMEYMVSSVPEFDKTDVEYLMRTMTALAKRRQDMI